MGSTVPPANAAKRRRYIVQLITRRYISGRDQNQVLRVLCPSRGVTGSTRSLCDLGVEASLIAEDTEAHAREEEPSPGALFAPPPSALQRSASAPRNVQILANVPSAWVCLALSSGSPTRSCPRVQGLLLKFGHSRLEAQVLTRRPAEPDSRDRRESEPKDSGKAAMP